MGEETLTDKIAEICARHNHIEETWWAPDDPCVNQAHDDRGYLLAEVERLNAEVEKLYNEDTKTRHALKGWVFVCPDGGDEPTHERVAAVVAEVERLHRAHQSACEGGDLLREEVERLREERRERISTTILAGLVALPNIQDSAAAYVQTALALADALIAELDREPQQ